MSKVILLQLKFKVLPTFGVIYPLHKIYNGSDETVHSDGITTQ